MRGEPGSQHGQGRDRPLAEPIVKRYLAGANALPEMRIAYARELMEARRYADATTELTKLTREKPDLPGPWILLGSPKIGLVNLALQKLFGTDAFAPTGCAVSWKTRALRLAG